VLWWQSSERARELLTETAGYIFEALLNSGRSVNSPANPPTCNQSSETQRNIK
jgi:hypothetical protein